MTSQEKLERAEAASENTKSVLFALPQSVMHDAVGELAEFVLSNLDQSLVLDGSQVRQIGAQGAQVLVMAAKSSSCGDVRVTVRDPNGTVKDCTDRLGLSDFINFERQGGETS